MYLMEQEAAALDNEKIKEYFPLDTVIAGMFDIYQNLLGYDFVEQKTPNVWSKETTAYKVFDRETQVEVGMFYLDLHPRDSKFKGPAVHNRITQTRLITNKDGQDIYYPITSAILCNFNRPTKDKPSLLSHGELKTLFHEFGHAMDSLSHHVKYFSLNATPRDFVEAPSQMLENWVWNEEGLSKLSGHYLTGQKLPQDLLQKMIKLRDVGLAYGTAGQIMQASIDLDYHNTNLVESTTDVWRTNMKKYTTLDLPEGVHPQSSFGHLMGGYQSGYYGYLWAKVYAQDMFTSFEESGILDPTMGMRYRREILQPGGLRTMEASLKAFLGREPNNEAFYRSLGITN